MNQCHRALVCLTPRRKQRSELRLWMDLPAPPTWDNQRPQELIPDQDNRSWNQTFNNHILLLIEGQQTDVRRMEAGVCVYIQCTGSYCRNLRGSEREGCWFNLLRNINKQHRQLTESTKRKDLCTRAACESSHEIQAACPSWSIRFICPSHNRDPEL